MGRICPQRPAANHLAGGKALGDGLGWLWWQSVAVFPIDFNVPLVALLLFCDCDDQAPYVFFLFTNVIIPEVDSILIVIANNKN